MEKNIYVMDVDNILEYVNFIIVGIYMCEFQVLNR
jgi:hypothetical protein